MLVFSAVKYLHRRIMFSVIAVFVPISFCVVLFKTAPYRLHEIVADRAERQEKPRIRAAASLFHKSPKDDFRAVCREKVFGFHKA